MPATRTGTRNDRPGTARQTGERRGVVDYGALPDHVGYLLRLAQLRVWEDFYGRLGDTGVSPALFSALVLILNNPGLQQSRLGEALGVARSGAMTMVDRLEQLGIVERRADPTDRRAYGLFLTPAGEGRMADLVARVRQHDTLINAVLTPDEHRTLMRLLRKFIAAPAQTGGQGTGPAEPPATSRNRAAAPAGRRQTPSREDRP